MASILEHRPKISERLVRSADCSPAVSRSSSVSSNLSEGRGRASSLKNPLVTVNGQQQPEKKSKAHWASRLSEEYTRRKQAREQKKAEEKARNERLKNEILRVMSARQAAEASAKLNGGKAAPVSISHMSAAQLEMRYPHSGPPAIRGGHKDKVGKHNNADMPALARIVSGDEVDDEEEQMKRHRDDWRRRTRPDSRMRQVSETTTPPSERDETVPSSSDDGQDVGAIEATLEAEKFRPKPYTRKSGYIGFKKDQKGVWTKDKERPHLVHSNSA